MKILFSLAVLCLLVSPVRAQSPARVAGIHAGAAVMDISPTEFPALINGNFTEKEAQRVTDPLAARALVLDDGSIRIALCVVDTCMIPRELIDEAKAIVSKKAGIPVDRILISATHTHSAPSAMGCLGVRPDSRYAASLPGKIAESILIASQRLVPARVGSGSAPAWHFTNCRRWIRRPDKLIGDPFGVASGRAHMHPGHMNPDAIAPSGPIDPDLSVLSVQTRDGKPLAVFANFSMHYYGATAVSSDYFGRFASQIGKWIGAESTEFVGIMSQGTSGDSQWMDYSKARDAVTIGSYTDGLLEAASSLIFSLSYSEKVSLAMAESRLLLERRQADAARMEWVRETVKAQGERPPKSLKEVYANEALFLAAEPRRELKLQALRIGDLGITAIPNEVYAITGLKLKAASPLAKTFNIELANGAEGYIPPPEQHVLGGYTTWAARTAGLEVGAEPRIVESLLTLLETVSGSKRRALQPADGPYAQAMLAAAPAAYWRMEEIQPPTAFDASGNHADARYAWEKGVAFFLPGAGQGMGASSRPSFTCAAFSGAGQLNRSPHFAGGHLDARLEKLPAESSVSFWFWNGLDPQARSTTGCLFGRGSESLQITGKASAQPGALVFFSGTQQFQGKQTLRLKDWHHLVLVRTARSVSVYLDGQLDLEVQCDAPAASPELRFAGSLGDTPSFEGKLDEIAVFPRALGASEVASFYQLSGPPPHPVQRIAGSALKPSDSPSAAPPTAVPALSAQESLRKLRVPKGMQAELVAAEPLVLDPVAFDWDLKGRLWVVEMADYPLGLQNAGIPGGRIRILEDTDQDGVYDRSTLFAEGLNYPNGILTWKDGVLVTAAPDVLFLRDTDHDGVADEQEILLSGLQEGNQQLRANGLRWGLDNWVYVAAGGHHGKHGVDTKLLSHRTGKSVLVGSRDFRFQPDTGAVEPQSGPTQFGRNRDNWGHWFGTQNSNPLWHYLFADSYLRRNPWVSVADTRVQLLAPQNPPVFPASTPEKRYHGFEQSGRFTSACSGVILRDAALFAEPDRQALVCEPFHNLVQLLQVNPLDATFSAQRAPTDLSHDFIASEDRWSRPVMVREGPDGSLFVADMYRYMIEHPQFLPAQGKDDLLPHYRAGDDRGRIFRIRSKEGTAFRFPIGSFKDTAACVSALVSSNGWIRDKAQQSLVWSRDPAAVPLLRNLARDSQAVHAQLHALWTLEFFNATDNALLVAALNSAHPGLRENAIQICERHLSGEILEALLPKTADADPKVRLQLAFSLGQSEDRRAGEGLVALLKKNPGDAHLRTGVLSSAVPHLQALAAADLPESVEPLLLTAFGAKNFPALATLFQRLLPEQGVLPGAQQLAVFTSFLQALDSSGQSLARLKAESAQTPFAPYLERFQALEQTAITRAADPSLPPAQRIALLGLLARLPHSQAETLRLLEDWLHPRNEASLQSAALKILGETGAKDIPVLLAKTWPNLGPVVRQTALQVWMSRELWTADLLERIQKHEVVFTLDPLQIGRLTRHHSLKIREAAAKAFGSEASKPRQAVLDAYASALSESGDPVKGHAIYQRACFACHKRGNEGREIGPDLASVIQHPPEKLLRSILDPNADIQPGYTGYTCTLASGEQIYGLVSTETANSVTLKLPDASQRTIPRNDIRSLQSQNVSLMPEGFENAISPKEMADLLAFLRSELR